MRCVEGFTGTLADLPDPGNRPVRSQHSDAMLQADDATRPLAPAARERPDGKEFDHPLPKPEKAVL